MTQTKRPAKKTMTKPEAISYAVMGFVAFVALFLFIVALFAIFLMVTWPPIAAWLSLPLLDFPAAFSISLITITVLRMVSK